MRNKVNSWEKKLNIDDDMVQIPKYDVRLLQTLRVSSRRRTKSLYPQGGHITVQRRKKEASGGWSFIVGDAEANPGGSRGWAATSHLQDPYQAEAEGKFSL